MSARPPSLTRALAVNMLPAYLAPLVMSGLPALLIGDEELARASYTSIAPPSALAALIIVLVLHRRTDVPSSVRGRIVATGIAFSAFFALASLVFFGLRMWHAGISLREAPLSFAIGAAVTTAMMLRDHVRRAAGSIVAALALSVVVGACAASPPRPYLFTGRSRDLPAQRGKAALGPTPPRGSLRSRSALFLRRREPLNSYPLPTSIAAGAPDARASRGDVIEGVRPQTSRSYGFIVATCASWADEADAEATVQRTRQRRGGIVSTVAGILGTASGITGGALASRAHGDGDDDAAFVRSLVGGVSAMGFGLVATSAGIATSRAGRASGEASSVVAAIEEAIARHTIVGLASMDPSMREASIVREGVALARECSLHASRLSPTASLGIPADSPLGMRHVSNALVRARDTNPRDEELAIELFGEPVAVTGAP